MATKTIGPPRIVKPDATQREVLDNTYRILNGQSWTAGDFLYLDTNGLLTVCADDADSGTGGIKFYANETVADPEDNTTFASVTKITEDMEFEGNVWHSTAASALAATSLIGQQKALEHSNAAGTDTAAGYPVVDLVDSGNAAFEITGVASDYDPSGRNTTSDVYGLVRFKVLPTVISAAPA